MSSSWLFLAPSQTKLLLTFQQYHSIELKPAGAGKAVLGDRKPNIIEDRILIFDFNESFLKKKEV
jgi:hypothetical protein